MLKYRGNIKDQWIDFKYWGLNWLSILGLVATNPYKVIIALFKYPWIYDLLKTNNLVKRYNEGRNGTALLLSNINLYYVIRGVIRALKTIVYGTKDTVLENCMVPTEIYQAMDLKVFMAELPAALLPMEDQHTCDKYMDLIENNGLPGDTCSYPRITAGVFAAGEIPRDVKVLISNNLPCEAGMQSHAYYEDNMCVPAYRLDVPYNFKEEDALNLFVEDIRGLIAFLEKHTGHLMDWDKLREVLTRYNQMNELELEHWEMTASDNPPLANENIWIPHFWNYNIEPGNLDSIAWYNEIHKHIKKAYDRKESPLKNLRFRSVLWNPPTFAYAHFWNWLEQCWGIACLNDMESFGHFEDMFIDTTTNETMLKGLAKKWCNATMSRHTRGPMENYLPDLWHMFERFRADFILVAGHIGCRSSVAMTGLMKEEAQKRGIPFCIFDYELMDSRVCSHQGIRDQINSFMVNVMKATPLDERLLVIDDDTQW